MSACYRQRTLDPSTEPPLESDILVNISTTTPTPSTTNTTEVIIKLDDITQPPPTLVIQQIDISPTPSSTPTPYPSPTPMPTKQVLIKFGLYGGDGGSPTLNYRGRSTPSLILYSDGQILIREGEFWRNNEDGYTFKQAILTSTEICSLLNSINNTGFLEVEGNGYEGTDDPIYNFDDSVEFSEGGPSYRIEVNGINPKLVLVYYRYTDYYIVK